MQSLRTQRRGRPFSRIAAVAVAAIVSIVATALAPVFGFAPQAFVSSNKPTRFFEKYVDEPICYRTERYSRLISFSSKSGSLDVKLLEEIRSMRVKELKAELTERRISTADVFEKEELVQRLYEAKLKSPDPTETASASTKRTSSASSSSSGTSTGVLCADLFFTSVDSGRSMSGMDGNSQSVTIKVEDVSDPYPTIAIDVYDSSGSSSGSFPLKLLVDTACSGLVLRPSVVQRHSSCLKSYSTPVTMTGGAGAAANTGLTQIQSYSLRDSAGTQPKRLGPLPAAVQDIGALPLELDGILGLSLLSQFACTELDLENARLNLYETEYRPPLANENKEIVVAEAELSPTKLGIWTVDVSFAVGGRTGRPIKMLVDTGAMATFLTWKGLDDMGLGLSRSSPSVRELTQPMGAMGSDNVAMSLSHRIELDADAPISFGRKSGRQQQEQLGLSIASKRKDGKEPSLPIDIGNIGILENQLASDNVVGILGMDVFSKASRIRMTFRGPVPRITFYQKKETTLSKDEMKDATAAADVEPEKHTAKTEDAAPVDPVEPAAAPPTKGLEARGEEPETKNAVPTMVEAPTRKKKKKKKKRRYDD